jgi:hypothetical protein
MVEWISLADAHVRVELSFPGVSSILAALSSAIKRGEVRTRGGGLRKADYVTELNLDFVPILNPGENYPGLIDDSGRPSLINSEVEIYVNDLETWIARIKGKPAKKNGGAPEQFDWQAYDEQFKREVAERGFPDPTNVKGWRRQADVERWLKDLVENDPGAERTTMSDRTARVAAKRMMDDFRQ